ncbi:MAG TPA: hypothetical protein VKI61_05485 [Chitinophagaceae bacterium]|jgi:hypothetical protein|nr:hypothetical protein [Chitinophagaceae bacterium]
MDNMKAMELEILISIRNNVGVPRNELSKLFDSHWPTYGEIFNHLYDQGMFKISGKERLPGVDKFELTRAGNLMISKLLDDRSHDIHVKIAQLKKLKNLRPTPVGNPMSGLIHFFTHHFSPFKRPVH